MVSKPPQVDSHFHLLDFGKFAYPWPTAATPRLFRNFTVEEYEKERQTTPVTYSVFVQALESQTGETDWALETAKSHQSVKGIVAGIDLTSPALQSQLLQYIKTGKVVGVRNATEMATQDDWLARDDVMKGLEMLQELGFTYDLLLRPHLLKNAIEVVQKLPRLKFVVNHLATPLMKDTGIEEWKKGMAELAIFQNVYCKMSGMVTGASFRNLEVADYKLCVKHVLKHFGVNRCMFGSDWPVTPVLSDATYLQVYDMAQTLLAHLSQADKDKIFGLNAIQFYGLDIPVE